jgi:pimeloyl-ACP methyl ester carboxylesterase
MDKMRPAQVCEIVTPKKYVLRALWFGSKKPQKVFIFLHGLSGSVFSMGGVLDALVSKDTAVLSFNNRGFEWVSTLRRRVKGQSERANGGAAHEIFTDCVDDIEGAIRFARKQGVRNIYLVGHSTGCQKAIYWASKKNGGRAVKGIILLGPMSDYETELHRKGKARIERAEKYARALVRAGKKHDLLPISVWHEVVDAQRFLSLYTKITPENTFPYGRPDQTPHALLAVKTPVLVCWAEHDEYADRPAGEVMDWFEWHLKAPYQIVIVPGVEHGFRGGELVVQKAVRKFISAS